MAGRGRGRGGSGLSFTQEQLQALGIGRGENPTPNLAPPPLFPKIEARPLPLTYDAATDYMLIVKDQFIEYLHETPAYVKPKAQTDGVERYSDKYKLLALNANQGKVLDCVWSHLPAELRPQAGRMRVARKRKLDDPKDIVKKLQTLESKELMETSTDGTKETRNEDEIKKENDDDNEELDDEEEQEFELDDGTDYANNYFDNGEDYDEEDDNLDDGPVY